MNYCVSVVDQTLDEKRRAISEQSDDLRAQRRIKAEMYSDEVKVSMVATAVQ